MDLILTIHSRAGVSFGLMVCCDQAKRSSERIQIPTGMADLLTISDLRPARHVEYQKGLESWDLIHTTAAQSGSRMSGVKNWLMV